MDNDRRSNWLMWVLLAILLFVLSIAGCFTASFLWHISTQEALAAAVHRAEFDHLLQLGQERPAPQSLEVVDILGFPGASEEVASVWVE